MYRGFSDEENLALNAVGMFAVGIAWFPTKFPQSVQDLCAQDQTLAVYQGLHCHRGMCPWVLRVSGVRIQMEGGRHIGRARRQQR